MDNSVCVPVNKKKKNMCSTVLAQKWLPSSEKQRHDLFMTLVCVCHPVCRLVNENEVKQWKEQAEKMRKGL